jgi:predicted nuclease of predicted toxin-antitoxin system
VRFLIDEALSPAVAIELNRAGHDAVHVRDLGMYAASDEEIFDRAAQDDRVVVSADTLISRSPSACEQSQILVRQAIRAWVIPAGRVGRA